MQAADIAGSNFRSNRIHVHGDQTKQASRDRENISHECTCNAD